MNILYYCDEYPPDRNGGIGTVVKLVAEAMSRRGHNVVVAGKYWNGHGKKTIEQINGVTVIRWHKGCYYSIKTRILTLFHSSRCKQKIAQLVFSRTQSLIEEVIRQFSIDIVELPDYVDDFFLHNGLVTKNWRSNVPMIIRVHGSVSFLYRYINGKPDEDKVKQDRVFFNQADAIYAVSAFSKEYVTEYLCRGKDVKVIYNPIEELWFRAIPASNDSQTILYFGKIAEMKGIFSLIKAFNHVAPKFPNAKLKLIGSGATEYAKGLVEPCISNRVEFAGFMPQQHIMEEIDRASFCVLPSYFENFSMAALEVLARHKALIYTNRTSGPELIEDGINGFLIDPDNIEQLADRMHKLMSDVDLRNRLAKNGFEMCRQRFSTTFIIPQIEAYYKRLTKECK